MQKISNLATKTSFINIKYLSSNKQIFPFLVCFFILALMVMFRRADIGKDTINYINFHSKLIPFDFTNRFENGYLLVSNITKFFFDDSQFLLINCGIINYVLLFLFIKRFSKEYFFSLVCFITLGFFDSSMNIMRQSIATSLIACSYYFVIRRELLLFIVIIAIGASFHNTALLFLPVYFINNLKYDLKNISIIVTTTIIIGVAFSQITQSILGGSEEFEFYSNSIYGAGGRIGAIFQSTGYIFILLLALFVKKNIGDKKFMEMGLDRLSILVLIGMCILLLSYNMSVIGRIASYYTIFSIILVPNLLNTMKYHNRVILSGLVFIILNSFYYIIVLLRPEWSSTFPYYIFLNT